MKHIDSLQIAEKSSTPRVSVPISVEMLQEIETMASRAGVSRSAFLARLLQYGLEAERQKRDHFVQKIRQFRDSADPIEVEWLENEIGKMIFGQ